MTSMTSVPTKRPSTVPMGPAMGKNVVPGMTKAPQPTAQPKDSAQACNGER